MKRFSLLLAACLGSAALSVQWPAAAEPQRQAVKVSQFSGKEVPRFESLRYSAVHGRQGPSLDHPILWRYERLGLPVIIVRETHGWRRIRDPEGDEVWVQARMLSEARSGLVVKDTTLRKTADPESRPIAKLKSGAVLDLTGCTQTACEVQADKHKGWVDISALWGTELMSGRL